VSSIKKRCLIAGKYENVLAMCKKVLARKFECLDKIRFFLAGLGSSAVIYSWKI